MYLQLAKRLHIHIYAYLQTYNVFEGFYKNTGICTLFATFRISFFATCFLLISYFLHYLCFYFPISFDPIHSFNWQPAPQRYPFSHFNQLCHIATELFKCLKYSFAPLALRQCVGLAVLARSLATVVVAFIPHYLLCQSIWYDTFGDLLLCNSYYNVILTGGIWLLLFLFLLLLLILLLLFYLLLYSKRIVYACFYQG